MAKYTGKNSGKEDKGVPEYKRRRVEQEQRVDAVELMMAADNRHVPFEQRYIVVYGGQGLGKTKFGHELGLALQKKYNLASSGTYFLQCEDINHDWNIRRSNIFTWPTFQAFIDKARKNQAFVDSVKMWVIDPVDALLAKGLSMVCHENGCADPMEMRRRIGEDWFSTAYPELATELMYELHELKALGPGILLVAHERSTGKRVVEGMETEVPQMDLPKSSHTPLANICSMILRIRHRDPFAEEQKGSVPGRCLVALSETEVTKDNLNVVLPRYPDGTIPFETEKEAVEKLLGCFDGKGVTRQIKKTKKKVNKKVSKKKKKVRRR